MCPMAAGREPPTKRKIVSEQIGKADDDQDAACCEHEKFGAVKSPKDLGQHGHPPWCPDIPRYYGRPTAAELCKMLPAP